MAAPVVTTGDLVSAADWNAAALGELGHAERTSNFNNLGPSFADCGLAVSSVSLSADRRVKVSALVLLEADTSAARGDVRLLVNAGQIQSASTQLAVGSTGRGSILVETYKDLSAGSHDFKVQIGRSGADTVDLVASATAPAWLSVEDAGPQ